MFYQNNTPTNQLNRPGIVKNNTRHNMAQNIEVYEAQDATFDYDLPIWLVPNTALSTIAANTIIGLLYNSNNLSFTYILEDSFLGLFNLINSNQIINTTTLSTGNYVIIIKATKDDWEASYPLTITITAPPSGNPQPVLVERSVI